MCMAKAISNNDNAMINEISKLKQRIYLENIEDMAVGSTCLIMVYKWYILLKRNMMFSL